MPVLHLKTGLLALATLALGGAPAAAGTSPELLIISDRIVLQSKFDLLRQLAAAEDLETTWLRADSVDEGALAAALQTAGWLVVDAPRPTGMAAIRAQLQPFAESGTLPARQLWVGRDEGDWRGLDPADGERLRAYYRNGGKDNFRHFVQAIKRLSDGLAIDGLPEPVELPPAGGYHPRFSEGFAADPARVHAATRTTESRGRVAIGFHPSYLESADLAHVDAMVAALEQRGVGAIPVFYSLGADADLPALLAPLQLDALIHMSPVYHTGLRAQLERLAIPVLTAIGWSDGGPDDYREDTAGLSLSSTPIYLAMPEQVGMVDPVVAFTRGNGHMQPIPEQIGLLADKAARYVDLRAASRAQRKLALMVYNYPPGERNISASFLNVPRSLAAVTQALAAAGYTLTAQDEDFWIERMGAVLQALHQPDELRRSVERGEAALLSVADYRAWYDRLSATARARIEARWGAPEDSPYVIDGRFAIPHLRVGNLAVLAQPPRGNPADGDNERGLYHDLRVPVNHHYLATYLWLRRSFGAHALIHFGTHGTQEWMPGKERGLHAEDDPFLALGDLPVIYPYIIDNVGEATQAKRRGRAVMISHQTPPFRAAGLYGELVDIHTLVHQFENLEPGEVRQRTLESLIAHTASAEALVEFPWNEAAMRADPDGFLKDLHDHLHEVADHAQPVGLHTFGSRPQDESTVTTILQMLGEAFFTDLGISEPDELHTTDAAGFAASLPYRWVAAVVAGEPEPQPVLPEWRERVRELARLLDPAGEMSGLLQALDGLHLPVGVGGDPLRAPDSLPSGRNLYGFDPSALPTREAWQTGRAAMADMLRRHAREQGAPMRKAAFSLWAVEAMRHGGVLESQALYAMGLRPVWNNRGRVVDVEVIPREELGRPRVDVVLSATGLYRDQFANLMGLLASGAARIAELDEPDNPSFENSNRILAALLARGVDPDEARYQASIRLFGSPNGVYGTGLEDAALASDTWEGDDKLARLYLRRMSHAFGPDPARWGEGPDSSDLYAENLKGVEAALLARTSNLYGMLTTDDPFQYLGGLSLAVRHLTGKSPSLYISNQRRPGSSRIESANTFLATELQARTFHPEWIRSMQAEGYAGALNLQDMTANLWGWQVTDPSMVTGAQWQRFHEVYVNDAHSLGLREWFETHQPEALLRMVERMLEATRKDYWQPSEDTLRELVGTWRELRDTFDLQPGNPQIAAFAGSAAAGFGLAAAAAQPVPPAEPARAEPPAPDAPAPVAVSGQQLVAAEPPAQKPPSSQSEALWLLLLTLPFLLGAVRQWWKA
jgi:cobaltochelatase CobN